MQIEYYPEYIYKDESLLLSHARKEGIIIGEGLVEHIQPFRDRDLYFMQDAMEPEDHRRTPDFYILGIGEDVWRKLVRYSSSNNARQANGILKDLENRVIHESLDKGYYVLNAQENKEQRIYAPS